jgi:arabinose-5-phosphate isomerase
MPDSMEIAKNSLQEASQAIRILADKLDENFTHSIDMIMDCRGRIIISGMGKSGHIGRKIAATLASTGTPSFFIHPAEAFHGDLGMIRARDVILLISNSGETDEVIKLIPSLKRFGNKIISIANDAESTLAKNSDVYLDIHVDKEACPNNLAPTTSTTVTLALGDALAVALMKKRNFQPENFAAFHPGGSLGRRLLTRVKDQMLSKSLPIVSPKSPMNEVILTMTRSLPGIALVALEDQKLLGVITDGDLRRTLVKQVELSSTLAEDIMTSTPVTISEDDMLVDAERIMTEKNITKLVVTRSGFIRGIIELNQSP